MIKPHKERSSRGIFAVSLPCLPLPNTVGLTVAITQSHMVCELAFKNEPQKLSSLQQPFSLQGPLMLWSVDAKFRVPATCLSPQIPDCPILPAS